MLLKNENAVLPLKSVRKLAMIGRLAAAPNTGDGGSSNTQPAYVITPLEGLRAALGETAVLHDDGSDLTRAGALARDVEAAVVVVGYTHEDEGEYIPPDMIPNFAPLFPPPTPAEEAIAKKILPGHSGVQAGGFSPGGDRERLTLHPRDEQLIQTIAAENPRTIVVMMIGSAVITEAWRPRVPAILVLWYPGMEGGHALADILLGRINPSGRLPCTFPRRAEDLPSFDRNATRVTYDLWHGYRKLARDHANAAFPFGFGLSYTAFERAKLELSQTRLRDGDTLDVGVEVRNTGTVAGDDIIQLYIAVPQSRVDRAPRELKRFQRVSLSAGEMKRVSLRLNVSDLRYYDSARGWTLELTRYEVLIARHAEDSEPLSAFFDVV